MRVKDLIKELETLDQNAEIKIPAEGNYIWHFQRPIEKGCSVCAKKRNFTNRLSCTTY